MAEVHIARNLVPLVKKFLILSLFVVLLLRTASQGRQGSGKMLFLSLFHPMRRIVFLCANAQFRTPSPTSPYPCLYPGCGYISSRADHLKRHMTIHFPPAPEELLDCRYEWCGRTGAHGFKREYHREEHYRKVHGKGNEYPKTGEGGKSGRSSGKSSS